MCSVARGGGSSWHSRWLRSTSASVRPCADRHTGRRDTAGPEAGGVVVPGTVEHRKVARHPVGAEISSGALTRDDVRRSAYDIGRSTWAQRPVAPPVGTPVTLEQKSSSAVQSDLRHPQAVADEDFTMRRDAAAAEMIPVRIMRPPPRRERVSSLVVARNSRL